MPFGAYKINAWGGNSSDAPVLPNGLQVSNNSIALTFVSLGTLSAYQFNGVYNNVGILGYNNGNIYFVAGQKNVLYYAAIDSTNTITGGSLGSAGTADTMTNNVSCLPGNVLGPGSDRAFVLNTAADSTGTMRQALFYTTAWANNTSSGPTSSGNASLSSYTNGANALTCPFNDVSYTSARSVIFCFRSSFNTQLIATYSYGTTGTPTAQVNLAVGTGTQDYKLSNGIRMTTFNSNTVGDVRVSWVGFPSNAVNIGALLLSGTTSPTTPGTFYTPGITFDSSYPTMLKTIWDDNTNNINLAVLMHNGQYLRIIKYSSWTTTGATITGSQDFSITSNNARNTWYRLCSTGINGLGAIVYFDPYAAPAFKIKFFNINSAGTTITFGNPIDLAVNTIDLGPSTAPTGIMSAEVKWTPWGFAVGIFASDNVSSTQFFTSILWPVNKPNFATNATISFYPSGQSLRNYLSNTQYKFGNSSLFLGVFSTAGVRVNSTNTSVWADYNIGTSGDFTVECWINPASFSSTTGTQNFVWRWGLTNYGIMTNVNGGVNRISLLWNNTLYNGLNVSTGTWYHTALVRTSGTIYLYVNGTRYAGPTGDVTDMGANYNLFGSTQTSYSSYVDEFRISNVARYTAASITPPQNPFTYDTNTLCLYHFNANTPSSTYLGNIVDDWGQAYPG